MSLIGKRKLAIPSVSRKGENYELALIDSPPPLTNSAAHPRCSLIGPAVSNKENNNRNKTSSNQFKAFKGRRVLLYKTSRPDQILHFSFRPYVNVIAGILSNVINKAGMR
ncbi:hypothetical protein J6590_035803 [Homalodisca vitripennis]|nr:hypothetical protein J6590_035803 [Homalodisca vitripennis]